ncbi:triose phosphate/phosphate translocator, chloroplastic-like [Dorcoceras hygrometricum]|uniref:Triose phosphate/phosphate translocator, chloroplastic-like n=1 Tax=Dorcoceras hygrometricum TaxID=472368 RepID=A0A2Z6ZR01_9LAMI|nr:triose phosphate/phosphate translocator, chloroplastic-like [Dorcoceras hygrometricum]
MSTRGSALVARWPRDGGCCYAQSVVPTVGGNGQNLRAIVARWRLADGCYVRRCPREFPSCIGRPCALPSERSVRPCVARCAGGGRRLTAAGR